MSEAQQNASRENGQKSHGATSPEGKAICSRNAVKHGLCARKILIHPLDLPAYEACLDTVFKHHNPVTDMEKLIVQEVADTTWKLQRVAVYESGLQVKGRLEAQKLLGADELSEEERHILVEAEIQHTYSKSFTNLSLQQEKAQKHLEKKIAQFEKVRNERELLDLVDRKVAMESILGDPEDTRPCHPNVGSVFPIEYLAHRVEFIRAIGEKFVAVFDRAWGDLKAKRPA